MEENKKSRPHNIIWTDRKKGSVSGVKDVVSFDDGMILLETDCGVLHLKGKHLHIGRLSLDQGEVDLDGEIESIVYTGSRPDRKGKLIKRMLR